jgi:hypothetical protein
MSRRGSSTTTRRHAAHPDRRVSRAQCIDDDIDAGNFNADNLNAANLLTVDTRPVVAFKGRDEPFETARHATGWVDVRPTVD